MNQPARAFMALEEWQKLQLEGVVFCYDLLKEQGLLKGFACIQETRAYTESFVSPSKSVCVAWSVWVWCGSERDVFFCIWMWGWLCVGGDRRHHPQVHSFTH